METSPPTYNDLVQREVMPLALAHAFLVACIGHWALAAGKLRYRWK